MALQYTVKVLDRHGDPKQGVAVALTIDKLHWLRATTDASGRATITLERALTILEVHVNGKQVRQLVAIASSKEETVRV